MTKTEELIETNLTNQASANWHLGKGSPQNVLEEDNFATKDILKFLKENKNLKR